MKYQKKIIKKLVGLTGAGLVYTMSMVTAFAESESTEDVSMTSTVLSTFLLPILLLVFLYFIMIRPQQKQEKSTREMQKNLKIGDEVVTIGGIVGIVMKIEENTGTVVLETGSDRLKIRLKQDAIKENVTATEIAQAEKAKAEKNKTSGISLGKSKDE